MLIDSSCDLLLHMNPLTSHTHSTLITWLMETIVSFCVKYLKPVLCYIIYRSHNILSHLNHEPESLLYTNKAHIMVISHDEPFNSSHCAYGKNKDQFLFRDNAFTKILYLQNRVNGNNYLSLSFWLIGI